MPKKNMTEGGIWPAIYGTHHAHARARRSSRCRSASPRASTSPSTPSAARARASCACRSRTWPACPRSCTASSGSSLFVIVLKFGVSLLAGSLTLACLTLPVIITVDRGGAAPGAAGPAAGVARPGRDASCARSCASCSRPRPPASSPARSSACRARPARPRRSSSPRPPSTRRCRDSPLDQVMALPYHLYIMATQAVKPAPDIVWGTALVLVVGVTVAGVLAAAWRSRQRSKIRW